jgi:hypothetical protein
VRLFVALALAIYLSGVPAVAAYPCAETPSGCCASHAEHGTGRSIGACGCQSQSGTADAQAAVTTVTGSADRGASAAAAVLLLSTPAASDLAGASTDSTPPPRGGSPPRLSGTGFRC